MDAARELGCDEDPERFKEIVRKLAKAPPAPRATKASVKGGGRRSGKAKHVRRDARQQYRLLRQRQGTRTTFS